MLVDLHVHSTASDGTFPPIDILRTARGRHFSAIALTDHDNCDGIDEFMGGDGDCPPLRIPGIELSIEPGDGFDRFHLLGLGVDHENAALKRFLANILEGRNARNAKIIDNFRRKGIEMGDEINSYAHGDVLARPHFARWLVDHRHASSVSDAFERYLLSDSPAETRCYEERYHPSQEEAFSAVHGAGGICVMAHPRYWRTEWKKTGPDYAAAERELAVLKEKGLDGLESVYQANSSEENLGFTLIACRLGLLKTAGSDFHGSNKPDISLGMEVDESFVSPTLERLSCGKT
ncbi:MAG: PHP domain-containing protein [Kiritimatiellae bacterium]|nr:PHP domain-containing protein [Kiritimatiellia bacterium]